MAKTLDFNKIRRFVLPLVMQDEAQTVINVGMPREGLIEELVATTPELQNVLKAGDQGSVDLIYDLAARLINCNTSFVTVTAEELRDPKKYNMGLEELIVFYSAYLDFINEINSAKN